MRQNNIVYVDGAETRRKISARTGKKDGIKKICAEKGITSWSLNAICRNGFGTFPIVQRYIDAGIPIVISTKAKPNRIRKEHSRKANEKKPADIIQKKEPERQPKQLNFEDIENMQKAEQIRNILIDGLTAIIEELKKI